MSVISPEGFNLFKSSSILYSKVKRFLKSYGTVNLIDDGEFPVYVKEVLRSLGIGVYEEKEAVVKVKNFKAVLPKGFSVLYAAYKCTPTVSSKDMVHPQGGASIFNDITWEILDASEGCEIDCCEANNKIIEKVTVRQFVKEQAVTRSFVNPVLLRLSPNVKRDKCMNDCQNLLATSIYEITIDNGFIYTNFDEDCIYIKYYALPLDEEGRPSIPDIEHVEKAIEWYIIYQTSLQWWFNSSVPDLEKRWQYAEAKYNEYYDKAKNYIKTPSFARMVNLIRRQRSTNKVAIMRQIDYLGYWQ